VRSLSCALFGLALAACGAPPVHHKIVPPSENFYTIAVERAELAARDPGGACWTEVGCGAPDPLIKIRVNGIVVAETDIRLGTFQAMFDQKFDVHLVQADALELGLYSASFLSDRTAAECAFTPLGSDGLNESALECTVAGNSLHASIAARITE
jgi:hypothetical protein